MFGSSTIVSLLSMTAVFANPSHATIMKNLGCKALELSMPSLTFWPGNSVYEFESQDFWSNFQILGPACVFRPTTAAHVSAAALLMGTTQTAFAVRGGGHMAIQGANSIDGGPLIVMSNLTNIELTSDKKSVWVGPGLDWGQVYRYLDQYDLAVAGGRLSPVGVPGLLLGGGISFHGNQRGWSADNVLEYEIVLSTGIILNVTAKSHPDLFWALKGGANNFGIVTRFKLATFRSAEVYAGVYSVTDIDGFVKVSRYLYSMSKVPTDNIQSGRCQLYCFQHRPPCPYRSPSHCC